jgi:NhaP-type Na+/H+ or K+/H+ antiporter
VQVRCVGKGREVVAVFVCACVWVRTLAQVFAAVLVRLLLHALLPVLVGMAYGALVEWLVVCVRKHVHVVCVQAC